MEVEIWKNITGMEGRYQISNLANIRTVYYTVGETRVNRVNPIKQRVSLAGGYYIVCLRIRFKVHTKKVHKLLATEFIPNPENKPFVNHKDGNKLNNSIDNLEWCTSSENNQHAWDTGLKVKKYGEDGPNAKLSNSQRCEIVELLKAGTSATKIASMYNVTIGAIYPIKNKIKSAVQC